MGVLGAVSRARKEAQHRIVTAALEEAVQVRLPAAGRKQRTLVELASGHARLKLSLGPLRDTTRASRSLLLASAGHMSIPSIEWFPLDFSGTGAPYHRVRQPFSSRTSPCWAVMMR